MDIVGEKPQPQVAKNSEGFLKGNAELIALSLRFFDLTMIIVGSMLAHLIRFNDIELGAPYKAALVIALFASATIFPAFEIYKPWRGASVLTEIRTIVVAWLTIAIVLPVIVYLTKTGDDYSRLWFVYWVGSTSGMFILSRIGIRYVSRWARQKGFNTRNILIVGAGDFGQRVSENLQKNQWVGINTIGFLDDSDSNQDRVINGVPVLGRTSLLPELTSSTDPDRLDSLCKTLDCKSIDQVWIALPISEEKKIREVSNSLFDSPVSVVFVPDIFVNGILNHSVDNFAGMPVVNLRSSPMLGISSTFKLIEDIVLSSLILIATFLPMMIIAILIKLESKGPVIFKQRRYGIDGKEILVWKFRTMNVMEDSDKVVQAKRGDSRVTRLGAILRRTSLDELPQFFNVLQGRMSIVGPRPHAVAHNEKYRKIIDTYMWRCKVKPGITGWAQVNGWRGETDTVDKMEKRVEYDLEYLKSWSVWFDLKIILKTVVCVFNNKGTY
ncbi:MAG: undecaprenyl-phosphate glucose phosphotransferase [Acidiferrobacterales bacterium]|nr:undecaprenyl-phosphate glucose phosphotransferase [Acidiferrobacterales bacterium]